MLQLRDVARNGLLRPVTLTVGPGQRMVVAGPSGCGKTLLLRSIAELDPHEGTVLLDARPSRTWGIPAWRSHVMYIPQRPTFPTGTVRAALQAGFAFRAHQGRSYSEARALELLDVLGRPAELLDQSTMRLSGGESQSIALVRAVLLEPRVLLADEITAALDADLARRVETFLLDWSIAEDQRAVVWVGHNDAENQRVGTAAITLEKA